MRHHVSQYFRQNLDKHKSYKNFYVDFSFLLILSLEQSSFINQWFQVISFWETTKPRTLTETGYQG